MPSPIQRLRALVPGREQLEANRSLRALAPHLANPKLWQWSRRGVAAGVALGLFIGLLIPVAQILIAAAAAVLLRVNLPIAAACTLITNPLTFPPIYYAAYQLGVWVTGSSAAVNFSLTDPVALWENLGAIGLPLFTGLGITATCTALVSYFLVSQLWSWRVAAKRRGVRP